MQVLLEWLSDEVLTQWLEETLLRSLALEKSEHAPRDTNDREVLVLVAIVLRSPFQDVMHLSQVLIVFEALFGVAGNVDS